MVGLGQAACEPSNTSASWIPDWSIFWRDKIAFPAPRQVFNYWSFKNMVLTLVYLSSTFVQILSFCKTQSFQNWGGVLHHENFQIWKFQDFGNRENKWKQKHTQRRRYKLNGLCKFWTARTPELYDINMWTVSPSVAGRKYMQFICICKYDYIYQRYTNT